MAPAPTSEAGDTVIAQGVRVEGEFVSAGNVVIEGEVHGAIATSQHLIVGAHAKIVADVRASTALVAGNVEGNLYISGRLELKATSQISGDVTADDLIVESGAIINGRLSMKQQSEGAAAPRRKKAVREEVAVEASEEV